MNAERPAIYLAGPDVFFPDVFRRRADARALCEQLGLEPLHPLDNDILEDDDATRSVSIYRSNVALIRRAAGMVANLTPFRGVEPDSGTVWEVGFALGLGKPVWAYMDTIESQVSRVDRLHGPVSMDGELVRDRDRNMVEDFGHPMNLMLQHSIASLHDGIEAALRSCAADLACGNGDRRPSKSFAVGS